MGKQVRVRALRSFRALGDSFPTGAVVALDPLVAADVLASGRAELVDKSDLQRIREAVQADTKTALRAAGPPPRIADADPWRRLQ